MDSPRRSMLRSFQARLLSFAPQTAATLVLSRLIIGHYGVAAFSAFSLMFAVMYLIPLQSFGVGVSLTSALATDGPGSPRVQQVLLTAARVMAGAALGVLLVSAVLTVSGLWPRLLGSASGPNVYYGIGVALFALSFLPGLAADMLLGVDRNHIVLVAQGLITPVIVVLVGVLIVARTPWGLILLAPPAAVTLVDLVLARRAGRAAGVRWRTVLSRLPWVRRHPGAHVLATAGPMMVISISAALATQLDRVILSHVSTTGAVAAYALAMQMFAPAVALVASVSQPLWPMYVAARAQGRPGPSLARLVPLFAAAGVLGAALLVPLTHLLAGPLSGGRIDIGWLLPVAGGTWVALMTAAAPISSALMDARGLRLIAGCNFVGVPANLGLSVLLAQRYGASGPLWASVLVVVVPLPALYLYARRRQSTS